MWAIAQEQIWWIVVGTCPQASCIILYHEGRIRLFSCPLLRAHDWVQACATFHVYLADLEAEASHQVVYRLLCVVATGRNPANPGDHHHADSEHTNSNAKYWPVNLSIADSRRCYHGGQLLYGLLQRDVKGQPHYDRVGVELTWYSKYCNLLCRQNVWGHK